MIRLCDLSPVVPMFDGRHDTMIRACLAGFHGGVWADDAENPSFAVMVSGDFTFFAGTPDHRAFSEFPREAAKGYTLLVPPDGGWDALINTWYADALTRMPRWSILHEPGVFDEARLRAFRDALPAPYALRKIDEDLYRQSFGAGWSCDLCANFRDWPDYRDRGLGFAAVLDGQLVSGVSSYAAFPGGYELEADTHPDHRRRGLARACAAAMILECLARGLYPGWDAANRASVALAESLGYHEGEPYMSYEVRFS